MAGMTYHKHIVKKGEHLTGIAKKYGLDGKDWKKLYNHPKNAKLKKQRPDPNVILPKDEVFIPEYSARQLWDMRQALLDKYDAHVAMQPPLDKLQKQLRAQKKLLTDLVSSGTATKQEAEKARKSFLEAKASYKSANDWLTLCQRETRADGLHAATAWLVCKRETDEMWKSLHKMTAASDKHALLVKKYDVTSENAKKALKNYTKSLDAANRDIEAWKRTHKVLAEEVMRAMTEIESMLNEAL